MTKSTIQFVKHKVAHHFENAKQEFEAAKLGMWTFLIQELLFFSALFVAYAIFRFLYPEMFLEAASHLDWRMGALNTVVLITSSFTIVMAVRSAQLSQRKNLLLYLIVTFLLAGCFMVVKYIEYMGKIEHGYLPTHFFFGEGEHAQLPIFFGLYFVMTGLHGLHVVIGMGVILWLIYRAYKNEFYEDYFTPVEMVALYWHFVDLVWIFLFPLFYLVG